MTPPRFCSWFTGVGMFDLALIRAGLARIGACEIEPFPRKVYVRRLGAPDFFPVDLNDVRADEIPDSDVWIGGSPCQDFSVAGNRAGMDGERSGLVLVWLALAKIKRPEWIVIENVPGLLSGRDEEDDGEAGDLEGGGVGGPAGGSDSWFGTLLGALADSGYRDVAWRVLDAQHFGVAQRRRRVFVVAHLGDGARAAEVLFEPEGVQRNPAASGEARASAAGRAAGGVGGDVASTLQTIGRGGGHRIDAEGAAGGHLVPVRSVDLQNTRLGGDLAGTLDTTRPTRGGGQAVLVEGPAVFVKRGRRSATPDGAGETWDRGGGSSDAERVRRDTPGGSGDRGFL